jgi:glutathione S-transferase
LALVLYDLDSADGRPLSPFGWRVRLALAHKGLAPDEVVRVKFTEKDKIAFAQSTTTPVLVDGDAVVADSWRIACHLEDAYPDRPSLFGGDAARALARYVNNWAGLELTPAVAGFILPEMAELACVEDRDYLRRTREPRFGPFEKLAESRSGRLDAFRASLGPLRLSVRQNGWLHGALPGFADYAAFGAFHWARLVAPSFDLLAADDPLYAWRDKVCDLHDGMARRSLAA